MRQVASGGAGETGEGEVGQGEGKQREAGNMYSKLLIFANWCRRQRRKNGGNIKRKRN